MPYFFMSILATSVFPDAEAPTNKIILLLWYFLLQKTPKIEKTGTIRKFLNEFISMNSRYFIIYINKADNLLLKYV